MKYEQQYEHLETWKKAMLTKLKTYRKVGTKTKRTDYIIYKITKIKWNGQDDKFLLKLSDRR